MKSIISFHRYSPEVIFPRIIAIPSRFRTTYIQIISIRLLLMSYFKLNPLTGSQNSKDQKLWPLRAFRFIANVIPNHLFHFYPSLLQQSYSKFFFLNNISSMLISAFFSSSFFFFLVAMISPSSKLFGRFSQSWQSWNNIKSIS